MGGVVVSDLVKALTIAPEWPVVQPGPSVRMPKLSTKASSSKDGYETCVVLPDMQIGYFRARSGELEPTHDENAIDIAFSD
jgi:hypothetical protein